MRKIFIHAFAVMHNPSASTHQAEITRRAPLGDQNPVVEIKNGNGQKTMAIEYRIVEFHQQTGSIQVKFFNEDLPQGVMFSITLPFQDGRYPQGEALDKLILSHVPQDIFERAAMLREQNPDVPDELPEAQSAQPDLLFGEGIFYVREKGERIFIVRPLLQLHALDMPLEVI